MTINERLQEAFDKRVGGTAMLPASELLSAMSAIEQLEETIAQQAEAIRLKDEALIAVRDDLELRMRIAEDDSLNISNSVLDQMCDAIDIQPSPEILQARDDLMAVAAFRYSLGRMTYIVSDCATEIRALIVQNPSGA